MNELLGLSITQAAARLAAREISARELTLAHLDAMEAIFGNLSQPTFRRFLRQATSVQDILTLLEEADAKTSVR